MNLPTISMDRDEARKQAEHYRAAVRERRSEEDAMMARAFREVAKGTPLIRLSEAIVCGGTVERTYRDRLNSEERSVTLPAVAVARADGEFAWSNGISSEGALTILGKREISRMNRRQRISFPAGTFSDIETKRASDPWGWGSMESAVFNALIPSIPPPLRPANHLRNYHLLFEADWQVAPGPPPGDPALLKHVGGDLYAVLAVWDLTEVEQAVLAGRELPDS